MNPSQNFLMASRRRMTERVRNIHEGFQGQVGSLYIELTSCHIASKSSTVKNTSFFLDFVSFRDNYASKNTSGPTWVTSPWPRTADSSDRRS